MMSDLDDLVFLYHGWMFLNLLGLISFLKLRSRKVDWKPKVWLEYIVSRWQLIFSIILGLMGFILVGVSFSLPWYYHLLRSISGGYYYIYLDFIHARKLEGLFTNYFFYAYFVSLSLLFVKISVKGKVRGRHIWEVAELLFIIPGLVLIFNIKYDPPIYAAILTYIRSGYSSGFILYTIGISILIVNGLQSSMYSRLKRILG